MRNDPDGTGARTPRRGRKGQRSARATPAQSQKGATGVEGALPSSCCNACRPEKAAVTAAPRPIMPARISTSRLARPLQTEERMESRGARAGELWPAAGLQQSHAAIGPPARTCAAQPSR